MTRPNNNEENQNPNTLMTWATGYTVLYAIGIAAGVFIWRSGMLQTVTRKILSKKESV